MSSGTAAYVKAVFGKAGLVSPGEVGSVMVMWGLLWQERLGVARRDGKLGLGAL